MINKNSKFQEINPKKITMFKVDISNENNIFSFGDLNIIWNLELDIWIFFCFIATLTL